MVKKMVKLTYPPTMDRILRSFILWFFCFSPLVYANSGVDWLINQAQPQGHYSTPSDIATPFEATAETWRTLTQMNETPTTQPTMTAALDFLKADSFPSTEHLARTLITWTLANQPVDELITELTARLQYNGGLGDLLDYDRTVIDTALALEALAMTDFVNTSLETLYPSINFLLQPPVFTNGGWAENDNETSVYLTAIVMRLLWHYRHHVSNIPSLEVESALEQAQAYLLAQLAQGETETFATALALIAIIPQLPQLDEISSYLDALRTAQLANGSWDNDVYTTALALRALEMAETPIPNPDLGHLAGIVVDATNNNPLSNVEIVATFEDEPIHLISDQEGHFEIHELSGLTGKLSFTIKNYLPLTLDIVLRTGETLDLGQVRLPPKYGDALLPDLVIEYTNPSIPIDPQTLTLSGQITTEIKNAGTMPVSQNITLLAFYDMNGDGIYHVDDKDLLLGETVVEQNLAIDETLSVAIPITGQLPFRDAPITIMVDNRQIIAERNEKNNNGNTTKMCFENNFDVVVKWEATGFQVSHVPIVGPLQDTNGDGLVNQADTPAVIVTHTYASSNSDYHGRGFLIALDGKTGEELWRTPFAKPHGPGELATWGMTPALGDIDGDGVPEVVAISASGYYNGYPIVFNNKGTEKWRSEETIYGNREFMGITLADLDHDGLGEIIAGRTVYNSDGSMRWRGYSYSGQISSVVDLNGDNSPEVIIGGEGIHWANGNTYDWRLPWSRHSKIGYVAIGNFDSDFYPEIVAPVGKGGQLTLFEHDGQKKWGPINMLYDSVWYDYTGAPVVADMDGDEKPDIGLLGGKYYKVFDGVYGIEKWRMPVS
jgi:hypothetical protein